MAARDAVLVPARVEESLLATGEAQQANSMDEATFRLLYDKLAHPIAAYVRRITGDRSLSEDILQEVFCRLITHPVPYVDESRIRAYLYKIATRLVYDHWRRLKREKRWSFIARTGKRNNVSLGAVANRGYEAGPILGTDIERAFHRLKPQERALLWLAYVEGCEHFEIAQILGLKERSVRVPSRESAMSA